MTGRKLLVEGWRFLPHSYAMVNQWQLLALRRRGDIDIRIRDLPLYVPSWQTQAGLFDAADERWLRELPSPDPGFAADVTLRMGFPFDLAPAPTGRLAVFCTSEYQVYQKESWARPPDAQALAARYDLLIVTPSRWSAEGVQRSGVPREKIAIVPHGVDLDCFAPDRHSRSAARARLKLGNGIVFMNAGAMTANKGTDLLLHAFAELCRRGADVYLLLKGTDALYRSNARVGMVLHAFEPKLRDSIERRIVYAGATLSNAEMAALYRAADVYVSPYRAEGFNLPVLEAMASGLPVICTAGGPTDDFVTDDCGVKIASQRVAAAMPDGSQGVQLQPDLNHLTSSMRQAASDAIWRHRAGQAARQQAANFTWDSAAEKLIAAIF